MTLEELEALEEDKPKRQTTRRSYTGYNPVTGQVNVPSISNHCVSSFHSVCTVPWCDCPCHDPQWGSHFD